MTIITTIFEAYRYLRYWWTVVRCFYRQVPVLTPSQ